MCGRGVADAQGTKQVHRAALLLPPKCRGVELLLLLIQRRRSVLHLLLAQKEALKALGIQLLLLLLQLLLLVLGGGCGPRGGAAGPAALGGPIQGVEGEGGMVVFAHHD